MSRSRVLVLFALLAALAAAGCGAPAPARAPAAQPAAAAAPTSAPAAAPRAPAPAVPAAPAATSAPAAAPRASGSADLPALPPSAADRKIIKDGEMKLQVANTDRAIDQITQIVVDAGGYLISSQTTMQDNYKTAALNLGVPVDQFEAVQRRVRTTAIQVLSDTATGQDVSDEYVDLQSRLKNLQATADRIREFLAQAKTVDEALKVNQQLSDIEGQIEQVQGRMNYISDRAAVSTLRVDIEQQRPTPTPTLTATPTPTPTPVAWRPGQTFKSATGTLGTVSRGLGDVVIWGAVVLGPFIVLLAVLWLAWRQWGPKRGSRRHDKSLDKPGAPAA